MKQLFSFILVSLTLLVAISCNKFKDKIGITAPDEIPEDTRPVFDSTNVSSFFKKHPLLEKYQAEVRELYKKHQ